MSHKSRPGKLTLNKTTMKHLSASSMAQAAGGVNSVLYTPILSIYGTCGCQDMTSGCATVQSNSICFSKCC